MDASDPTFETGCCPRFDPTPWDEKELEFRDRLFIKDHVRSFLHIPINFGGVMTRNMKRIQAAGAGADEPLVLSNEKSLWGADVYIAVSREVPGATMARISGTFLAKAFEGPYRNIRSWIEAMKAFVAARGKTMKRMLFFYTTCPRCAKAHGRNYVVLLAEV